MAASEQTYYNLRRLHVMFAASALALAGVTVWMIAADWRRPWKQYQAVYRDRIEPWTAGSAWLQRQLEASAGDVRGGADRPVDLLPEARREGAGQRFGFSEGPRWPSLGERLLRLPGLEALARPLTIEQVWLPDLPVDYHFRQVPRFDRCRTCHFGIDRALPEDPSRPAWEAVQVVQLELPPQTVASRAGDRAWASAPAGGHGRAAESAGPAATVAAEHPYGIVLAPSGVLDELSPTVEAIWPQSAAAMGGLRPGDVLLRIGDVAVGDRDHAEALLAELARQGKPVSIEARRGLPHPFRAHPRLDLFVGEESPHPESRFGCTVCHEGQGSATDFRFAAHTPNDPGQRRRWQAEYRWSWSEDWEYPMRPARFAQSNCLKCHFDVVDLEPFGRILDPPAPKLLEGYHLVRQLGCFGCHEISGFDAEQRPLGPDLRLEPPYHEAAAALLAEGYLDGQAADLARQVMRQPEEAQARQQLIAWLRKGEAHGAAPPQSASPQGFTGAAGESPIRQARVAALVALLEAAPDPPGTMRKVGPSLRHVAEKLDAAFLQAFVAHPVAVRPTSRMPRLFGLDEHLQGATLQQTRRFEAVEIRAIAEYLLAASQPIDSLGGASAKADVRSARRVPASQAVGEKASAERGKRLFQRHGCLACHRHADFPESQATQGPDLTGLGAKLREDRGRAWLIAWLRDPTTYSPRTLMPNPLLQAESASPQGSGAGDDPAADIAAYLLQSRALSAQPFSEPPDEDLDALVRQHLAKAFPPELVEEYLRHGIPEGSAAGALGDAVELVGPVTRVKKLRYVGRRTIRKRGCYGCHDVPGFEGAQPIGPPLTGWGRKHAALLDFGQVERFLGLETSAARPSRPPRHLPQDGGEWGLGAAQATPAGQHGYRGFYLEAIRDKRREGFLWQKLRQPRSFDYGTADMKPLDGQLLMGQFALSDAQREAIITFVLGLLAEPPPAARLPQPDARRRAIVEGRKVLDKYACPACHTMELERWTIEYDPAKFPGPPTGLEYPFLRPQVPATILADSLKTDLRGLARAELVGMPQYDARGRPEETEDDEGNPAYAFLLWEPAAIAGKVWPPGSAGVVVAQKQIVRRRPPWGGEFARLLYPVVLSEARSAGSSASVLEAWGWVPPPLVHEGSAVQPAWLHDYLLAPYTIRPAAVLRMPRYNLSAGEAAKLVDYFAARSGADFPYASDPRSRPVRPEPLDPARAARHQQALRLVTDRTTYCAKCHLVGDWGPEGQNVTVLAPNLQHVARRLRPEYVRRWLANPRAVLPYTAMPVNFPLDKQMGQELLPGSSPEQLDAVLDLLLDYEGYLRSRISIRAMVEGMPKSTADGPRQK